VIFDEKMYKIRIILDAKKDVIRTILVEDSINLETLHQTIAKSFGFDCLEMASFYQADRKWQQGKEIPLINMSDQVETTCMREQFLKKVMPSVGDKLIYVYDFLLLWVFYVETIEISDNKEYQLPKTILSIGKIPEKAPEKEFIAERTESDGYEEDEFNDDLFESLDDIDPSRV